MNKLVEALEAAYGFSRECGLTEEQEKIMGEHIEKLKQLDFGQAGEALEDARSSFRDHECGHYSEADFVHVLKMLDDIRTIFDYLEKR